MNFSVFHGFFRNEPVGLVNRPEILVTFAEKTLVVKVDSQFLIYLII